MEYINNGLDATQLNASRMGLEAIAEQNPTEETELVQYVEQNAEQPVNTAVMISGCAVLPSVQNQSEEALEEPTKMAETMLSNAKWALKHTKSPDDLENYNQTCKTTICLNSWLLYREVQKVENVKLAVQSGKFQSFKDAWPEYKLTRKRWESRKDITFEMVKKATDNSLEKLESGDWDVSDLPTIYSLNQENQVVSVPATEQQGPKILKSGDTPRQEIPENSKFNIVYGDLAYKINIEEMRNYIAEDAVGFFWVDFLHVQNSLDILKNLRFTVKEFCCLDTGKSHAGVFTNRQHRTMIVACKGKAPTPEDFTMESVLFDREFEKTDERPLYYAETIQQMYPHFPVLEIHDEKFKYLNQNYLISEAKGAKDGTNN